MATRDPGSEVPDVGDGLWDRLAEAVRTRQGAVTTLWNGRLDFTDRRDPSLTAIDEEGTIRLHPLLVETLSELHRDGGAAARDDLATAARSHRYIEAAATAFARLTVSEQDWMDPRVRADYHRGRPDIELLEVGFAEAHTRAVMPELAGDVLPPDLAARLNDARQQRAAGEPAPSPGAAAVTAFANNVSAQVAGRGADDLYRSAAASPAEILRVAAREDANTAFYQLGNLMYENSRLPYLVPDQQQLEQALHAIRAPVMLRLGELQWAPPDEPSAAAGYGVRAAEQAGAAVRSWEQRYTGAEAGAAEQAQQWQGPAAGPLDPLSGTRPPEDMIGMPVNETGKPAGQGQPGKAQRQNEL